MEEREGYEKGWALLYLFFLFNISKLFFFLERSSRERAHH